MSQVNSFLKEGAGDEDPYSFRRVVGSFFALVLAVMLIIVSLRIDFGGQGASALLVILGALLGIPALIIFMMAFFTTWGDIGSLVDKVKGKM